MSLIRTAGLPHAVRIRTLRASLPIPRPNSLARALAACPHTRPASTRTMPLPVNLRTEECPSDAKWLKLEKIHWRDKEGKERVWEAANRKTRTEAGVDSELTPRGQGAGRCLCILTSWPKEECPADPQACTSSRS